MTNDEFPLIAEVEAGAPPDTKAVGVAFGLHPVKDEAKSKQEGRPVFKEVEFIRIIVPGDKTQEYFNKATDKDRQKYPRAYEAFKRRGTVPVEGTPLEQWPELTRAEVLTIKAMHIHTVEMLAAVHEGNIGKLGFRGREYVTKANAFLARAKAAVSADALAASVAEKDAQIADLQRQINELAGKRGRPRNAESVAA